MIEAIDMPEGLEFRNAGTRCDLLFGPCCCGAWHLPEDLAFRIFNQLKQPREGNTPQPTPEPVPARKNLASPASYYATLLPKLREIAATHGYALALHGSLTRDCDLVAVPWQEWAHPALTLVTAIRDEIGGWFHSPDPQFESMIKDGCVSMKPHGRRSYSIHLTAHGMDGPYLDISVTPLAVGDQPA